MQHALRPVTLALAVAGLVLSGCAEPLDPQATPGTPAAATRSEDVTIAFNPQPEPPAMLVEFTATGNPASRMTGRLAEGGIIVINGLDSRSRGRTLFVQQIWQVVPPEPVAPITVQLSGIINWSSGQVVLNGATAGGMRAHVRGLVTADAGIVSIGGELMFNPQPEPPAR